MPINHDRADLVFSILTDRPIAYHPMLAKAVESVTAGVLLSQLLYWTPRTEDPEGWFWKTREEIWRETGLTRYEQEGARKTLARAGILDEAKRGLPAKVYYRIDFERLAEILTTKVGEKPPPSVLKSPHQDGDPPPTTAAENPPPSLLEAENTTESTTTRIHSEITESSKSSKATPELDKAITQVSKELGDLEHVRSNRTRARNLGQQYGLDEPTLIRLVRLAYEATKPRRAGLERPMAYLFDVLKERAAAAPGARQNLAGRYWRLVEH